MTFRQFTALATVAKHGNITKAAQAMRISQPSLSNHLKALEEDYRIRLFVRNGKGIQLTEDGAEFLMRIDPILAQLKNIQERYLNNSKEKQVGPTVEVVRMKTIIVKWLFRDIPKKYWTRNRKIDMNISEIRAWYS